jgi:chemotaxis regulatin CheY-phosphate phosphatase CheZ
VVSVLVGGRSALTQLTWANDGDELAAPDALQRVVAALVAVARECELPLLFDPLVISGMALAQPAGERIELDGGAHVILAERGADVKIEPVQSIDEVCKTSESAVIQIGSGLTHIFNASKQQCADMAEVVHAFDSGSGGLADSLKGVEHEVAGLGTNLRESLAQHRNEVQGAVGWATDIIALARSVDQIAQSARLLTFNARLESARLGEQGKGFVVIANAIRDLANDVRSSNEVVTRLATSLASTLPRLQRATTELADSSDRQLDQLRARLGGMRESFEAAQRQTLEALRRTESTSRESRDQSHEVLLHLQFQDRTSQLLRHAIDQIVVLEQTLGIDESRVPDLIKRVGELGRQLKDQEIALDPGEIELF